MDVCGLKTKQIKRRYFRLRQSPLSSAYTSTEIDGYWKADSCGF
jgi:hypothetical protein